MATARPKTKPADLIPTKPIAVGYNRQSRARPEDIEAGRVVSTSLQNEQNKHFALAHNWDYDEELSLLASDVNVSGARHEKDKRRGEASWKKRRGLALLFEAAQQGRFQHLIVYKLSRLGRSAVETADICESLGALGVYVHVVDLSLSTTNEMGKLMLTIISAVAEMELESIREWAKESAFARAQAGKHHGTLPSWIENDPDNEGGYRLNETVAEALQDMVAARLRGLPYSDIARMMNERQYRTIGGKRWADSEVRRLFGYEYRLRMQGWTLFGKERDDGDPRRLWIPDVFPPLITPQQAEQLEAVQRELVVRFRGTPAGKKLGPRSPVQAGQYLLSGLMVCHICGEPMHASSGSEGNRFYACRTAADVPGAHPDFEERKEARRRSGAWVLAPAVESAVLRGVGAVLEKFGGKLALPPPKKKSLSASSAKPKRDPAALTAAMDTLTDGFTSGLISKGEFGRQVERIEKERADWEVWEDSLHAEQDERLGWSGLSGLPDLSEGGESIDVAEAKLALRRVIEKVEYPLRFAGVRVSRQRPREMRWVRITFKNPLPDGEKVVLSSVLHANFSGSPRIHFGDGPPEPTTYTADSRYKKKMA